jgi:hypothetical protein
MKAGGSTVTLSKDILLLRAESETTNMLYTVMREVDAKFQEKTAEDCNVLATMRAKKAPLADT